MALAMLQELIEIDASAGPEPTIESGPEMETGTKSLWTSRTRCGTKSGMESPRSRPPLTDLGRPGRLAV